MHTITGAKRVNKIIILNNFMPINFKIQWANAYKNSTCQIDTKSNKKTEIILYLIKKWNPYFKIFQENPKMR